MTDRPGDPKRVALLVEDADLAIGISSADRAAAERALLVPLIDAAEGPVDLGELVEEPALGVLVLDGFLAVSMQLGDRLASQLAGPGDVLHAIVDPGAMVPARVSYDVVEPVRLAVLDTRFIAAVRRWPALLIALHERLRGQEHRLAVHAAIAKLARVEDRVLAVLWQLAEQWGRVTSAGVVVPVALTHATIGRLAGAKRPTVSLAIAALGEAGAAQRQPDRRFILAPRSWERLLPTEQDPGRPARAPRGAVSPRVVDRGALSRRIAALHDGFPERVRDAERVLAASREIAAQNDRVRRLRPGGPVMPAGPGVAGRPAGPG